jgi:hypothetical protein
MSFYQLNTKSIACTCGFGGKRATAWRGFGSYQSRMCKKWIIVSIHFVLLPFHASKRVYYLLDYNTTSKK